MQDEYYNLIDGFMCGTNCPCYEGQNGEIKQKWNNYGDQLLQFGRNNGPDFRKWINDKWSYNLNWSNDISKSYTSFKQCYDRVLKP